MKTYGSLEYTVLDGRPPFWTIECEPHVAIRLKRVFGKIDKSQIGMHLLSDTPENARDLAWFLQRYALKMTAASQAMLERRAAEHEERQTIADKLIAGILKPELVDLAIPLREYQKIAAAMILHHKRLLLGDSMGTGKSASAIGVMVDPRTRPALVVTLTHLPVQWEKEISRFAPQLKTHILKTGTPYSIVRRGKAGRGKSSVEDATPDVIITSYSKLVGWSEHLAGLARSVFYDEAQELRRSDSQRYAAATYIADRAEFVAALTGTPVYNFGSELHTVMRVIRPDALGTRAEFLREWCGAGREGNESVKNPKALGIYMRDEGLVLRRTRADVGRELPPLTRVLQPCSADTAALDKVSDACRELAMFLLGRGASPIQSKREDRKGELMMASEELSNKLRQATGIAKSAYVADFVRLLVESGEKVLLLGWHRMVYDVWLERLKDLRPVMFTGSETAKQKENAKTMFVERDSNVMIMSLRAGAGIDGLQKVCSTVVFGELGDWSIWGA